MSLQIAVLKVLSGRPDGRATIADVKADFAFFASVGSEWTNRMKRLASRAPTIDIFGKGLVAREGGYWQLTDAGRTFLEALEAAERLPPSAADDDPIGPPQYPASAPTNVIRLDHYRIAVAPEEVARPAARVRPLSQAAE